MNLDQWFKRRCLLKIFYLELCRPFCSAERNYLCNYGRGHYEEQFCEFISNLGQWFRRYRLEYFYLELWWPSCSVKRNHLCNFERGHHGEHTCEVICNLDQWFRRCRLKYFLSGALVALLFSGAELFVQFWLRA